MQYELHYSNGGHGGPYPTLEHAKEASVRLLKGCKSMQSIEIRAGVRGELILRAEKIPSWLRAARAGTLRGSCETIEFV